MGMLFHSVLLHIIICLFSVAIPPSNAATISSKPGCQSRCGNLQVPYPFGIGRGSNCSLNSLFEISCNTSFNPPKAYLYWFPDWEVVNISMSPARIYVSNWKQQLTVACYGTGTGFNNKMMENSSINIGFLGSPYSLSNGNQITSIGCDDLAMVEERSNMNGIIFGSPYNYTIRSTSIGQAKRTACVSQCNSTRDIHSVGSCPGSGGCRTSLSDGNDYVSVGLYDFHSIWSASRNRFACSFAFVGMEDPIAFRFYLYRLDDPTTFLINKFMGMMPLLLNWRINGSINCTEAHKSTEYACQQNSYCINYNTSFGYLCNCEQGYEGNPYLSQGCQDINECNNYPCHSKGICINTPGSYNCYCPDGYYGDATRFGTGCLPVPVSHNKLAIGGGLGIGMGLLLLLLTGIWFYKFIKKRKIKKKKEKFFKHNGGLLWQQLSTNEDTLEKNRLFTAKDLDKATDRFNESRILGEGGQGTVYKGMLSDGKIVAIKKSKLVDQNQVEQFINEVAILSQINHRNIVKLLGCCLETQVPLLVYEFISNGTLLDHIHDDSPEFPFTWNMRLKIAAEVAGALAYLHSATSLPVYHRDVKTGNILLDEKYVAKVSDFGISRSIAVDQTHLTTLVKGTFGYLDPEYFQSSQFTEKSDVYSYGVILVELLTRQRPVSCDAEAEERSLATRFLLCMEENNFETILDTQILEQGKREELIVVAKLAQRCLNLNGKKRPTMKEVAMELENVRMSQTLSTIAMETKFQAVKYQNEKSEADDEYTWTISADNTTSSSDAHPLMIHTV